MICPDLVDTASDLIQSVAPDGSFLFVNRAWLDTLGYSRQDVQDLKVFDIIHPDDRDHCSRTFRRLLEGEKVHSAEVKFFTKDGRAVWLEGNVSCHIVDGQPLSTLGIFRDISDRKRREEQLERDAAKLKHFAYAVAHDLKSPAIALHGITRLLHNRYGSMFDEKGQKYCSQVLQSSQLLSELVEKLNVYIETKEFSIDWEEVHLQNIFRILREEFSETLQRRGISLLIPEEVPSMRGDCLSLLRIFRNLIDNALKYGGPTLDRLEITCCDAQKYHIFTVRDNGCGIQGENHVRLFEYFTRKKAPINIRGTGMGLAIVKELVEQHGGKVAVESPSGGGTEFAFSIAKAL